MFSFLTTSITFSKTLDWSSKVLITIMVVRVEALPYSILLSRWPTIHSCLKNDRFLYRCRATLLEIWNLMKRGNGNSHYHIKCVIGSNNNIRTFNHRIHHTPCLINWTMSRAYPSQSTLTSVHVLGKDNFTSESLRFSNMYVFSFECKKLPSPALSLIGMHISCTSIPSPAGTTTENRWDVSLTLECTEDIIPILHEHTEKKLDNKLFWVVTLLCSPLILTCSNDEIEMYSNAWNCLFLLYDALLSIFNLFYNIIQFKTYNSKPTLSKYLFIYFNS